MPESRPLRAAELVPAERLELPVRLVQTLLEVPIGVLSRVGEEREHILASRGLPEPWTAGRAVPLSRFFGRSVVEADEPVAIRDVRDEYSSDDGPGATDLIAYAGVPLHDREGRLFAVLAAADLAPREWTEEQMTALADLASLAAAEVRLATETEERERAEASLGTTERRLSATLAAIGEAVLFVDREGTIVFANRGAEELLAISRTELVGRSVTDPAWDARTEDGDPIPPDERPPIRALESGEPVRDEVVTVEAGDRGRRTIEVNAVPVGADAGDPEYVVLTGRDVTRELRYEAELERGGLYDPLTELPNRRLLVDRLEQALGRARRRNRAVAVLLVDLERFRRVNETYGHAVGDRVLRCLGSKMSRSVRATDTVARLQQDEFTVVLESISDPTDAEQVAERLVSLLTDPVEVEGRSVPLEARVGLTWTRVRLEDPPVSIAEPDELIRRAQQALRGAGAEPEAALSVLPPPEE